MGKNGKRPKSYYIKCAKKAKTDDGKSLCPNLKGFLCTCNDREKDCVREAYNLLNEYADQLYGKEDFTEIEKWDEEMKKKMEGLEGKVSSGSEASGGDKNTESKQNDKEIKVNENKDSDESEDDMDIEAAISADVSSLKQQNMKIPKVAPGLASTPRPKRRFHQIRSGANNCIFIGTTLEDPLELSMKIMDDILDKQQQRTRRLIRMLPVQKTCKAVKENIEKVVRELAEKCLAGTKQRYCIVYKVRNNHSLNREEILQGLCKVIQDVAPECEADLKTPEVALNVEIIKTIACISLLPDFFSKYKKYNLEALANKSKREQEEKTEGEEKVEKIEAEAGNENLACDKENGTATNSTEGTKEATENIENENDSVNEKENLSVEDKEN